MLDLQASLSPLVSPRTVDEFLRDYWNRRGIYLPGESDRFAGLFGWDEFLRAADDVPVLKSVSMRAGVQLERKIRPNEIQRALQAGETICAGVVNSRIQQLQVLVNQFSSHFTTMGEYYFNSYYSPPGKGFILHFDDHPVWILQIEGMKDWVYSEEPALPFIGGGVSCPEGASELRLPWGNVAVPNVETFLRVRMRPGDILYLPRGCWHRAVATEDRSLHLTLAEDCARPVDVFRHVFMRAAQRDTAFCDPLLSIPRKGDRANSELIRQQFERFLTSLREKVNELTTDDLEAVWRAEANGI